MSIKNQAELTGLQKASQAVARTLKAMMAYARPGMSTRQLDKFGAACLRQYGATSAPNKAYGFPGYTCISVNQEFCHGIPGPRVLQPGDLVNIDVSAEVNGFWADNGASFVLGPDVYGHQQLVNASQYILNKAISQIRAGVAIAQIGQLMHTEALKRGYQVIKNLTGHGVGRKLHEAPDNLANYKIRGDRRRFEANMVIALETFIATHSSQAVTLPDGWTMVGNRGGYMAQHEHTLVVQANRPPLVLTAQNGIPG